jgi:nucleoside 2-deoxyribosyltransferase
MLNIYLAGSFSRKDELSRHARELRRMGHQVVSRWLDENVPANSELTDFTPDYLQKTAVLDIEDIDLADVIMLFSVDPSIAVKRGAHHFESGYAYGTKKKVIIVGPYGNNFHYLPDITRCATWDEAKENLTFIEAMKYMKKYDVYRGKSEKVDDPIEANR